MNLGFWEKLEKPILVLAPLANVTDAAFRRVIAKYGKPDVMWTEFVSADGLMLAGKEGREKLMRDLQYSEAERPIIAQFFTAKPEMMKKAAELATELGFDGVDINMGCPDRSIEKQGAGAALMKTPEVATALITAAKEGVEAAAEKSGRPPLPISVKIRIGYNKNEIEAWMPTLLKAEPAVIIIHGRTRKEMSKVPVHWDVIEQAREIRDHHVDLAGRRLEDNNHTLIFGNGDVKDLNEARQKARLHHLDGIMLGRAIFGNPWLFSNHPQPLLENKEGESFPSLNKEGSGVVPRSREEKLKVLLEHTNLFAELLGDIKSFAIMKKHYKAYIQGFDGAKELRRELMEAQDAEAVNKILKALI